jgi:hypothetical protein
MNARQKKKRRKKNHAIICELICETLLRMSPDDWKPPLARGIEWHDLLKPKKCTD